MDPEPQNDVPLEASIPEGAASLESILCTGELHSPPSRPSDYEKENRLLGALATALVDSKSNILETLAETIRDVTPRDSSGLSMVTKDDGEERFSWPSVIGMWQPHAGGLNLQAELEGRLCFNYRSAADQIAVARTNLDLANQALTQARDRFASGGIDTVEAVQAQRSVTVTNDNLITALYAHNLAKVELARWGPLSKESRNSWR